MRHIKIKLDRIKDAITFVNLASRERGNVWLSNDIGVRVSGKSVLGVFDAAINSVMDVEYSDSPNIEFEDFLRSLETVASTMV